MISFTALLISILLSQSAAQTELPLTANDVVEKVQKKYSALNDASAEFIQRVTFKYTKSEQSFSGTVLMKKGNKYRIESQQQTLVTDGSLVWLYSPINAQLLIDTYRENRQTFSPEKFLFGLPKNYTAVFTGEDQSSVYVLKLAPRSTEASKMIKTLKVWVSKSDWNVQKIEYTDMNETRTVYVLQNLRIDQGIDDSRFTFSAPAGTEVIDMRTLQKK